MYYPAVSFQQPPPCVSSWATGLRDRMFPADWQLSWLARTLSPWNYYFPILGVLLAVNVFIFSILNRSASARSRRELEGVGQLERLDKLEKRQLKVSRRLHFIAYVYFWNALALEIMDIVATTTLDFDDSRPSPFNAYDPDIAYFLLFLGLAAFVLVPILQVVLATWLVNRYTKKHGKAVLQENVSTIRFAVSLTSLWWTALAFVVAYRPVDAEAAYIARYPPLQVCLGSAVIWIAASSAFNYRMEALEQQDPKVCRGALKWIYRHFDKRDAIAEQDGAVEEKIHLMAENTV